MLYRAISSWSRESMSLFTAGAKRRRRIVIPVGGIWSQTCNAGCLSTIMPASPQTGGSCVRSASFRRDNSLNTVLIRGHLPLSSRSAPFGALGCSYPQPQVRLLGTAASLNARPSSPPQPPFDWIGLEEEKKIWGDFESNGEAVLVQDLRSDHAGETGAVYIYAGAQVRELGGRQTPSFVCDV